MKFLSKNETDKYMIEILMNSDVATKISKLFFKYRNHNDVTIEYQFEDTTESIIVKCDAPKYIINMLLECPDIYVDLLKNDYGIEYDELNDQYLVNTKINIGSSNYNIQTKLSKHTVDDSTQLMNINVKFDQTVKKFESIIGILTRQIDEYRHENYDLLHMLYFPEYVVTPIIPSICSLYSNRRDYIPPDGSGLDSRGYFAPNAYDDYINKYIKTFKNNLHNMLVSKNEKWYISEMHNINDSLPNDEIWDKVFSKKPSITGDTILAQDTGMLFKYFFDVMLFHYNIIPYEINGSGGNLMHSMAISNDFRCLQNITIVFKKLPNNIKYQNIKIIKVMDCQNYNSQILFNYSTPPKKSPYPISRTNMIPILYSFE